MAPAAPSRYRRGVTAPSDPPYIPWETLRDLYLARFGPLISVEPEIDFGKWEGIDPSFDEDDEDDGDDDDARPEAGEDAAGDLMPSAEKLAAVLGSYEDFKEASDASVLLHYELRFGHLTEDDPREVVASFGAAPRAGHEVFLACAVPFDAFRGVIGELTRKHAPLAPGMVVPIDIEDTAFSAVLLAPVGAGSIPLGQAGGAPRFALQVIPLTAAEAELGADSVGRLVAALRAAGALEVTDPLRDCVLDPGRTQAEWALVRAPMLDWMRGRLTSRQERYERLVEMKAPESIIAGERYLVTSMRLQIRHIEAKPVDPSSPAEGRAAMYRRRRETLQGILRGAGELVRKGAVPVILQPLCGVVLLSALHTHPLSGRLLAEAEGDEEARRDPRAPQCDVEKLLPALVDLIRQLVPDSDPAALLSAGRVGHSVAQENAAVSDGFVAPHVAWEYVLTGMSLELIRDVPDAQRDSLAMALQAGLHLVNRAFLSDDDRPALERLEAMSRTVVLGMLREWLEAEGLLAERQPEGAAAGAEREETEEEGEDEESGSPGVKKTSRYH